MAKKILIIDDSTTVRQQVGQALVDAGFEVVEAADGVDGLAAIRGNADVRAVICDINMPRKSGLEMLQDLHESGERPDLPILMLTSEGQPELIQRAKKAGAKGWIVKPFKVHLLLAAVQRLTA